MWESVKSNCICKCNQIIRFLAFVILFIAHEETIVILARSPRQSTGDKSASVIEFSVDLCVGVFWANFLISGRRHVIVARVTIEFAAR